MYCKDYQKHLQSESPEKNFHYLGVPKNSIFSTSISPPIGSAPDVGKSNYIHPLQAPLFPYILLPVIVKSPLLIIIPKHEELISREI
jgi:hypothetical protein